MSSIGCRCSCRKGEWDDHLAGYVPLLVLAIGGLCRPRSGRDALGNVMRQAQVWIHRRHLLPQPRLNFLRRTLTLSQAPFTCPAGAATR